MPFTWPTELDDAKRLLGLVGSFWADSYLGNDLVESLLHAKAQTHAQLHLDLTELLAATSRLKVPVFHREDWTLLLLRESDRNSAALAKYDGTYTYDGGLRYDGPVAVDLFAYPLPAGTAAARTITNAIAGPTLAYTEGVDYFVRDGAVWFRTDPLADPRVPVVEEFAPDGSVATGSPPCGRTPARATGTRCTSSSGTRSASG
jgi:hypothetical protein